MMAIRRPTPPMKMKMLARSIDAHLKRMEADPLVNVPRKIEGMDDSLKPFYKARATYAGGPYVHVSYVSFQGDSPLLREQAIEYLAWLDAGNNGKHFDLRESRARGIESAPDVD